VNSSLSIAPLIPDILYQALGWAFQNTAGTTLLAGELSALRL
jgi:hypothetical protein